MTPTIQTTPAPPCSSVVRSLQRLVSNDGPLSFLEGRAWSDPCTGEIRATSRLRSDGRIVTWQLVSRCNSYPIHSIQRLVSNDGPLSFLATDRRRGQRHVGDVADSGGWLSHHKLDRAPKDGPPQQVQFLPDPFIHSRSVANRPAFGQSRGPHPGDKAPVRNKGASVPAWRTNPTWASDQVGDSYSSARATCCLLPRVSGLMVTG